MDKDKVKSWASSIEAIAKAIQMSASSDNEDVRYEIREWCNKIVLYSERIEKNVKEEK